ncbi:phosphotransferase family protein [Streptomyces sp. NPDC127072]|uniref:phosphotransferase family protein n=1 Tax=Streptomyces sp. NPDC127072 TaxID=3347129 RepID=UPI0036634B44
MDFRPIERASEAFQQSVTTKEIQAICQRVFGTDARALSATELGAGMYNNTYRIELEGQERPVILRVAPEPGRQFRSEHQLMRNEYASVPWLAVIASLMPRVIAADWSHEIIGRDYVVQSHLDGVPAPERIGDYPRALWPKFFLQMGAIAKAVHTVRGPHFGPVSGPAFPTWSAAVVASLEEIAADVDSLGLDATDLREVAAVAGNGKAVLDEITEPRMIAGDFWTVNVMLDALAPEPVITGVLDFDRTWWGDPEADWTIYMASKKPGTERDAFWESYGPRPSTAGAAWRSDIYLARHIGAIRLERHRLGNVDLVPETYKEMQDVLGRLQA